MLSDATSMKPVFDTSEKEAEHRKIAPWSDVEFESFRQGHYATCTAPGDDRYCRVCGLLNLVLDLKERAA